jgi:TonB family protein
MISYPWLNKDQSGYYFYKQFIFNREFMMENVGRYKGYPMRTWDGNSYRGGYSDHFPTYIILLKKVDESSSANSDNQLLEVQGGSSAWKRFLEKNLNASVAADNGARPGKYTAIVSFTIDTSGNVTDVRLEKDPGYGVGAEALRVMKKSPRWQPATKNGLPVNYRQKQSITIVHDEF